MAFSTAKSFVLSTTSHKTLFSTKPHNSSYFSKKIALSKFYNTKRPLYISAVSGIGHVNERNESKSCEPLVKKYIVFRNIFSKKGMKGKYVGAMNYYGPKVWALGWQNAVSQIGPNFIWWVVAQSVFYHLYNQVSYMSLNEISPLTFSIGNTMKRIVVIVSSIIIFQNPIQPVNALGGYHSYFWNFPLLTGISEYIFTKYM
uniref:Sugar phosphate transporter domain-containing protein n=1 Tax=Solanum lycopersicum TaxID=4081 RepID=A0A3Q7HBM4_SOLLC